MSNPIKELEQAMEVVKEKFAKSDWKKQINEIASEIRRLGSEYSQQDKISGFVLEINGVDASERVAPSIWPELAFESDKLVVKMYVSLFGINF